MPRLPRLFFSTYRGSYHIISRTISDVGYLSSKEKDYMLGLLINFSNGFFVDIEAFCIMGNHFHILLSSRAEDAICATPQELRERYKNIFGKSAEPPEGGQDCYGKYYVDPDGGTQRLRIRLASVSSFVKEFKQAFTKWYNYKHERKGPLWRDRFRAVNVHEGDVRLICSSYIELNPVRAGIFQCPEKYRWSSLGMRVGNPRKARKFLKPISASKVDSSNAMKVKFLSFKDKEILELNYYRAFVYEAGAVKREGKAAIPIEIVKQVRAVGGELKIGGKLRYRMRNLSESIAIGSSNEITELLKRLNRTLSKPRPFLKDADWAFCTRCLHD